MMVESAQTISTDVHHPPPEKKEKNVTKSRPKRTKSTGKHKSSKKESNDKGGYVEGNGSADNRNSNLDNSLTWNSREVHDQVENVDALGEKEEPTKDEDLPKKIPSRSRSSKKDKKRSSKHSSGPRRTSSNASSVKSDEVEHEQKEKRRSSGRSLKSSKVKEDKRPSVPRRASDARESDDDDNGVDKSPGKLRRNSRQKEESEGLVEESNDKLPTKPGRRTARKVSPESKTTGNDDDELNVGSFHSLRKDSDKPRSRSRPKPSGRRHRTPTSGGKLNRRRKEKSALGSSDHYPTRNDSAVSDNVDESGTQEIYLKNDDAPTSGSTRTRTQRRRDRERLVSNDGIREPRKGKTRSTLSTRRDGMRRSHSERWNRAVESLDAEGAENPQVVRRRAHESAKRSDGLSRSAHTRVRRNNSSGPSRMTGSLGTRSYHGLESDRRSTSDGRRTPRRAARRHQVPNSSNSMDDSVDSFEDGLNDGHSFGDGRSQATLESIEDFEDYGEDFHGMDLQTPGMIDFEEEMLDLMQRANPEVTDHLDRRVHRKRESVLYDHNMPMMTRQALLTRQASSQVQTKYFDGSNIDKKRLLLRNDSGISNNSSHRAMRSAHGRRAPPRAKSSGLGAMARGGDMYAMGDSDDRRGVFRTRSHQTASFNQHYQNKNKVRNLSRKASGDLVQPHGIRRQVQSEHRRRPVQRAQSTTALRRSNSSDQALQKPVRKMSSDELGDAELESQKDMTNKRNRSKLHLLMLMTKMSVDMDVLFQKVREGEKPRSPIDALRMPSP